MVHPEANIIFGAVIDDSLGDEVRVTVIAAGFDGGEPRARAEIAQRLPVDEAWFDGRPTLAYELPVEVGGSDFGTHVDLLHESPIGAGSGHAVDAAPVHIPDPTFADDDEDDDLDVPNFLK